MDAGSAVEAWWARAWHYFPPKFLPWLPVKGSPKILFHFLPSQRQSLSHDKLKSQSEETEVGRTQALAEWGWTHNLKESSNSQSLNWKIRAVDKHQLDAHLAKQNETDFPLWALEDSETKRHLLNQENILLLKIFEYFFLLQYHLYQWSPTSVI